MSYGSAMRLVTLAALLVLGACSSSSAAPVPASSSGDASAAPPFVLPVHSSAASGGSSGAVSTGAVATSVATSSGVATTVAPDAGGAGVPTTLTLGSSTLSLDVAGTARTAVLYVPTGASSTAPLVIALHGDGDTDANFVATSGLQPLADMLGFVLVAPQGITRTLTVDGQTIPDVDWDAYDSVAQGNIDLPFLEQLRTQLQGQVDAARTFVLGYSQGGYMAFLYGLSDATVLSCAAVLAASSPFGGAPGDPLITGAARKIPVSMQIGTEDSAFSAAQQTSATLMAAGFPVQFNAIAGAGHVPIPGDIATPLSYCLGQTL